MRSDFSLNTVIYDTANKNKTYAKPRFELSTVQSHQDLLPTRGKSARYAREFSFARCHDEAGDIIFILLHCCPAGNTSRTGEPTSPAAKSAELNNMERFWRLESKEKTKDCCA